MNRKQKQTIFGIVVGALFVALLIGVIVRQLGYSSEGGQHASQAPNYETVLPQGKEANDLGGWQRVSPIESDPVFAYADSIGGIPISVSQQPLPENLKTNTEAGIAELAKSYSATNKLDANGTTVYVGTSAKGPQSTILTKKNLLILIKSQSKISDESWIAYVQTLN